ncbi:hypothetical protein HWV62_532 [Athelia sp. TMB]|nr:hypothetical protein HWV62_532 [Athelia sp. TMB]
MWIIRLQPNAYPNHLDACLSPSSCLGLLAHYPTLRRTDSWLIWHLQNHLSSPSSSFFWSQHLHLLWDVLRVGLLYDERYHDLRRNHRASGIRFRRPFAWTDESIYSTSSYTSNTVTITAGGSAATKGSDDASGTFRVHANSFKMYNVNVVNSYGMGSQALALSAYGTEQGFYGCSFKGYQDTVLTDTGTQFFGYSYVEGAVDFIFGQTANTYFYASVIASKAAGTITASGPPSSTEGIYVFDSCYIEAASDASSALTGDVYLGRPWTEYARAVFKYCSLSAIINSAGWEEWSTATPNTADVLFAEYENSGAGATTSGRASFSKQLTSTTVASYSIASILGSGYASWVDADYFD